MKKSCFFFPLFLIALPLALRADIVKEAAFEAQPGEFWQLDWTWREKAVPLTTFIHPLVTAYDADGKVVWSGGVGRAQQRVFDPKDLSVQKWRVYADIAAEGAGKNGGTFCTIAKIQLPSTTRRVKMTLDRLGDAAEIDRVTMGVVKLSDPPKQEAHSFPLMSEEGIKILTDAELDNHLARRAKAVPKLVSSGDRTELSINGQKIVPRIFKGAARACANRLPAVSVYSRKGFNVFTMGFSFGPSANPRAASSSGIWRPDGSCDVEKVRKEIREYLKRAPDAYFMLAFMVVPPVGWAEAHPSEIFRNEKGKFGVFKKARLCAYRDTVSYDPLKEEWPAFSYTSEEFGDLAASFMEKLFAGIEEMPEGKAVIGAYVCGGTDGQWLDMVDNHVPERQAADYSDVSRRRFAEFRRAKYARDDIETEIPPADVFWNREKVHYAEHASTLMSDYREFYARATTQFRLKLSKGVKRGSSGRVLVGSYSPQGGLEGYPLVAVTSSKELFRSPDYDFFAVVPAYLREHVDPVNAAIFDGTAARNGKLYVSELDLRSADVRNWGFWGSDFWCENHTSATFRRKTLYFSVNALTRGGVFHAYDMDGGWFAGEASEATWKRANELADHVRPMARPAERIAMVSGERYWDFQSLGKNRVVPYLLREQPREALSRAGVPFNVYLVDDILADAQAELPKVIVFSDLTTVSGKQFAELKRRYAKDGRVLVYLYRPGLFATDGAAIEDALGLEPAPQAFGKLGFADGTADDPLMKGVKGTIMATYPYYYYEFAPVSSPKASAGWKALANFKGTETPALAVRRNPNFTEVYSAMPGGITPELCRNFLREAKLEPFVDSNEITGYGSGLFYILAQSDGLKRFRLPAGVKPEAVLEGPVFRKDGAGYAVRLKRGEIFILTVRDSRL